MADAVSKTPKSLPDNANPSKLTLTHFIYKASLVTLFLVVLPLFPSLAPDFVNQTLHARSWELLQLIFVGIAVSYGLFSKKNQEKLDDSSKNIDNAQSYVSKLLQVSSVFDDESENPSVIEENKIEAMNSQYYRGEPVVVVCKETPVENGESITQKPLLLPVRSLKQRVPPTPASNEVDLADNGKDSVSRSGSKRLGSINSRKLRVNGDVGDENVVLPSPIPWRSRSGRMEMKDPPEQDFTRRESSSSFKSTPPNVLYPSKSFASESNSSTENVVRKKPLTPPPPPTAAPPQPPPPPPPPAPQFLHKPVLKKSNTSIAMNVDSPDKALRRSVSEVRGEVEDFGVKSVRTFRANELAMRGDKESKKKEEFVERVTVGADTEEEDDYFPEGDLSNKSSVNDVGPDVDKKADEFIAKFREQIRLQRIESIRRSTAQRSSGSNSSLR